MVKGDGYLFQIILVIYESEFTILVLSLKTISGNLT